MMGPLSSCCCDVEDEEENVSLTQMLRGSSKLHLKSMYELSDISKQLMHTAKPLERLNSIKMEQKNYLS